MIPAKPPRDHPVRRVLRPASVLLSLSLTVLAGAALTGSIANSSYDATENRAPEARIAIAAIATILGLAAIGVAVQRLRRRQARRWLASGAIAVGYDSSNCSLGSRHPCERPDIVPISQSARYVPAAALLSLATCATSQRFICLRAISKASGIKCV